MQCCITHCIFAFQNTFLLFHNHRCRQNTDLLQHIFLRPAIILGAPAAGIQESVILSNHMDCAKGIDAVSKQHQIDRISLSNFQIIGCKCRFTEPFSILFNCNECATIMRNMYNSAICSDRYRQMIGNISTIKRKSLGYDIPKA